MGKNEGITKDQLADVLLLISKILLRERTDSVALLALDIEELANDLYCNSIEELEERERTLQ